MCIAVITLKLPTTLMLCTKGGGGGCVNITYNQFLIINRFILDSTQSEIMNKLNLSLDFMNSGHSHITSVWYGLLFLVYAAMPYKRSSGLDRLKKQFNLFDNKVQQPWDQHSIYNFRQSSYASCPPGTSGFFSSFIWPSSSVCWYPPYYSVCGQIWPFCFNCSYINSKPITKFCLTP